MSSHVSVVIVSFNTEALLRQCLDSILRPPRARDHPVNSSAAGTAARIPPVVHTSSAASDDPEVIVVDNASSDASAAMVQSEFPAVTLIRNRENRGFAAACNQGISASSGQYVALLNPDTLVLEDAITRLMCFLQRSPAVGAVGPRLLNPDGSPQDSAFAFPNLPMVLLDFFPLHHRLTRSRLNGRYGTSHGPRFIDHPLGACVMMRRETLDTVGLLDEGFFMYCEEVDWCVRAKAAGWQICYLPEAVVVHYSGQSAAQLPGEMFLHLHASRKRLYRKHYGKLFRLAAGAITVLGTFWLERKALRAAASGSLSARELADRQEALARVRRLWRTDSRGSMPGG